MNPDRNAENRIEAATVKDAPENVYTLERVAEQYELLRTIPSEVFKRYSANLISRIPKDGTILEAGFGPGHILAEMGAENEQGQYGHRIVGIDNSPKMHELVQAELAARALGNKIELISESLVDYLRKNKEGFDLIHFKAILHCFRNPEEVLEAVDYALKPGGVIATGHEESQTEARIERLYRTCPRVDDAELEAILGYYFELRADLAHRTNDPTKDFRLRKFPAGDSSKAANYFLNKGYTIDSKTADDAMQFERHFTMQELLISIRDGTFGVFRDGLSEAEMQDLCQQTLSFCTSNNVNIEKVRSVPARLRQYNVKKVE